MAVSLVARKKFGPYLGQSYLPGEPFEARDESDAHVLTLAGVAARVETRPEAPEPPEPALSPDPDPVEADSVPDDAESETPDVPGDEPKPKRRYRRRDMQAEDS